MRYDNFKQKLIGYLTSIDKEELERVLSILDDEFAIDLEPNPEFIQSDIEISDWSAFDEVEFDNIIRKVQELIGGEHTTIVNSDNFEQELKKRLTSLDDENLEAVLILLNDEFAIDLDPEDIINSIEDSDWSAFD